MLRLFHNLFRPPALKKRLPLLPREWSSDEGRVPIEPGREQDIKMLIARGLAKTDHDAWRLLLEHPDWNVARIIKECTRKRKHQGRFELAQERLRRWW